MKIDLITLGCSKNLVDSEKLMRQLEANGYEVEHDPERATGEVAVINTCGFIGDAKKESIDMILSFAERRKSGELKQLIVMGCLSQRYRKELEAELPEVDRFYGKFDYMDLLKDLGKVYRSDLSLERSLTTPKHYAYVKISEGCNRTCSYCAIPLITGPYRSRRMEDIGQEVSGLLKKGVREFQLIAQDLTYYGNDLYHGPRLAELVRRLSDLDGVEWIRLHYAYPTHFPEDILKVMRERENVCNYLDIALQHISDRMLSLMRRNITKRQTLELLEKIRTEVPGIHIRTTLMVGHPGETEEDFEELADFVREQRFERMGAFTYSHEEETWSATHYADDIPLEEKQRRLDYLMGIQENISAEINEQKTGKKMRVVIDREEDEFYVGRTEYDSPEVDPEVLVSKASKRLETGQFYEVRITGSESYDLYGTVEE
ncbi:MAG: 30S ribosomal protein S12 methylthiotransferase RimO [Paludibacteraceae bacterium]|nr:30S ribosomal protein S12 methylthiotransferase RimO [Paludibacteraceae bacterium]